MVEEKNEFSEEFIENFCNEKIKDFNNLLPNLKERYPEWNKNKLAVNLMEFGRGQISGIGVPNDQDINFFQRYLASLDPDRCVDKNFFLAAYLGGCIMGLVQLGHLKPEHFIDAMEISRKTALAFK
jgi:hypothetical protein